jgi:4-hydroxy-tetrahydrodipicolinate synthase
MNQPHVTGLIAGPLVPFDKKMKIDDHAYRNQISRQSLTKGLGGIYVNGFVGEIYSLKPEERQLVIKLAREEASDNIPIISGIVGFTPDDLVQSAKEAQQAGADMVMVFPPYDNRFYRRLADRPDPPFELFRELSGKIDVPMWVFKFPKESGACYSNETMVKIADEISSVVGTKASAISCSEYYELWSALKGKISVFATGHDTPDLLGMMMLGSDGGMAGIMNIGEERWAEFIAACLDHDWGKARNLFVEKLVPISEYIYGSRQKTRVGSTTSHIKECLVQMGLFPTSFVHPPDTGVTQEEKQGITKLLESLDLIEKPVHGR